MIPSSPFFMTQHAPLGAWSALTLGLPGHGVGIDHQQLTVCEDADLHVAVSHGAGRTRVLPFFAGALDAEGAAAGGDQELAGLTPGGAARATDGTTDGTADRAAGAESRGEDRVPGVWRTIPASALTRSLLGATDTFAAEGLALTLYSPHADLVDPESPDATPAHVRPSILLDVTWDNRDYDAPAHLYLGLVFKGNGRLWPLDWAMDGLAGVGLGREWALAAEAREGTCFTVRDNSIRDHVEAGRPVLHPGGNEGGVLLVVPPGKTGLLTCAFAWYHHGPATAGMEGVYWYTRHYGSLESVCRDALQDAEATREACRAFDAELDHRLPNGRKRQIICQAIHSYAANTQLVAVDDRPLYSVCEGQYAWRNTLDLAADHLPWELWRFPWVVRNIMDLYLDRYSYRDALRFPGETEFAHAGGLAFCHDQGNYATYAPPGHSGYEMTDTEHYCHMTTEQVLNGGYALCAYLLTQEDPGAARRWVEPLCDLVTSLENRDHPDPDRRDGLLEGESSRCGPSGHEITTYDALDPSLCSTRGNLYIQVKCWCACVMLAEVLERLERPVESLRARAMAQKTAASLGAAFDEARGVFPANANAPGDTYMIAAIEALAVPTACGLARALRAYPDLFVKLKRHVAGCMRAGRALDSETGGLRLSSGSDNSWPSKGMLCHYVMEEVFGLDVDGEYPTVLREFAHWAQVSAAASCIADQITVSARALRGGAYYPRHVTSALWANRRLVEPA